MTTRTLIQAEELASLLGDPRLRLFDCRFDLARPAYGHDSYRDEHLPGAVYADLNRHLSRPATPASGRHPLPSPADFAAQLCAWGVNDDSRVVVCATARLRQCESPKRHCLPQAVAHYPL